MPDAWNDIDLGYWRFMTDWREPIIVKVDLSVRPGKNEGRRVIRFMGTSEEFPIRSYEANRFLAKVEM